MIYLDNAATTKMAPQVLDKMMIYFTENYGNPSAIYSQGLSGKRAVNKARELIAAAIGAKREEVFFTGSGSESDNWAIKVIAENYAHKGKHIITSKIEHHAVLHTCEYLEKHGVEVTYLGVDEEGMVNLKDLESAIREDTILISIMFANNEVGTIQPIREIGEIAHRKGILFHTDAVQALGKVQIDVEEMQIDLLSASAHKLHGPKGVGMLYARTGVNLSSFVHGGAQERNRRAGTENVPGIVGFGEAVRLAMENREESFRKEKELGVYLMERIEREISACRLNGHREKRLPGNVNFSFDGIESESLLIRLDMQGICASGGSACTTGSMNPSHVLLAMGRNHEQARGALRMTLSEENTKEELDRVVECLKETVKALREIRV